MIEVRTNIELNMDLGKFKQLQKELSNLLADKERDKFPIVSDLLDKLMMQERGMMMAENMPNDNDMHPQAEIY